MFHATHRILSLVFVFTVAAAGFTAQVRAGQAPPPPQIIGGGAKILINFADQQQSKFVLTGSLQTPSGQMLAGKMVTVSLGGVQRNYTLSPEGEGVATPDLFHLRDTGNGYSFIVSTLDNSLANAFQSFGLINADSSAVSVPPIPASITFNGIMYTASLGGSYYAHANGTGKAFLGVIQPPKDPFAVIMHIATLAASPNPSQANQVVTISGSTSLKNFTGTVVGNLHFGDASKPIHADGATFVEMLKKGITHTYTADGVYVARVSLIGGDEIADTRLFVIVGNNWVVNSQNGAVGRLVKTPGGGVTLQVGVGNVPGAMTAQTNFKDMNGNAAGRPPVPPPPGGQMGLAPTNTFVMPGVYVAEAMALDGNGKPLGKLRKTIGIGLADLGMSTVQGDGTQLAVRDTTTDSTITLTSMSGKFLFASTSADSVIFIGKITLPAGFTPKSATGNDITIAMGNVSDTVHLDSKNKLTLPTSLGYITKFLLTVPKLPNGVATGSEVAKVYMRMNTTGLILKGFDSEGISVSLRSDETGQTSVARFVQVEMLVGGQSYSSLVQVGYTTTSGSDFGVISGRTQK